VSTSFNRVKILRHIHRCIGIPTEKVVYEFKRRIDVVGLLWRPSSISLNLPYVEFLPGGVTPGNGAQVFRNPEGVLLNTVYTPAQYSDFAYSGIIQRQTGVAQLTIFNKFRTPVECRFIAIRSQTVAASTVDVVIFFV
jgi:hypothetical protein